VACSECSFARLAKPENAEFTFRKCAVLSAAEVSNFRASVTQQTDNIERHYANLMAFDGLILDMISDGKISIKVVINNVPAFNSKICQSFMLIGTISI
jgi:hypothetical protein